VWNIKPYFPQYDLKADARRPSGWTGSCRDIFKAPHAKTPEGGQKPGHVFVSLVLLGVGPGFSTLIRQLIITEIGLPMVNRLCYLHCIRQLAQFAGSQAAPRSE
jgi:hypothetical protein